ncbi:MAG: M15 family metallopeptidase [Proteobacteria bacterium]|nr:M15 family metallopeptidase [Pseudomonadota bacterium]
MLHGSTKGNITLLTDPHVLTIPIIDNHEPLVDLTSQMITAYGPSPEIRNNTDYTKVRKTVYEKLVQAQSALPEGLKLCLYEGYRSLALQEKLFKGRYLKVQNLHPEWSEEEIFNETMKLVSPIINKDGSRNIPPHSTGGAIDIYLIDTTGDAVDMGIQVKDWMEDEDGSLSQTDSQFISQESRENRKIMSHVLQVVGFINYPAEYWHWSYGDRYWAYQTGQSHAIYGTME